MKEKLTIAHLTVQRELVSGIRNQLRYEVKAARELVDVDWATIAFHTGPLREPFERAIPWPFKPILLRSLYGWFAAMRLSGQYDFVLVRHMTFDPFAFVFAPFVRQRVSVHHAKEIEELVLIARGWRGRVASFVERFAGAFAVRKTVGILGVTGEIARYERDLRAPGKPCASYPNGIDAAVVDLAEDRRGEDSLSAIFICGRFSAWHGLDRLVRAVEQAECISDQLRIHLVGHIPDHQRALVEALDERRSVFVIHGFLEPGKYLDLLAAADIGIGSLALDRQNMRQGSTLKVSELLASGIPVYSGHEDAALPPDFPYYFVQLPVELNAMIAFGRRMKAVSRQQVRDASIPYIEKKAAMRGVVAWLRDQFGAG